MKRAAHVRICCNENYLQCLFQLRNMSCIFHSPALQQKTGGGEGQASPVFAQLRPYFDGRLRNPDSWSFFCPSEPGALELNHCLW